MLVPAVVVLPQVWFLAHSGASLSLAFLPVDAGTAFVLVCRGSASVCVCVCERVVFPCSVCCRVVSRVLCCVVRCCVGVGAAARRRWAEPTCHCNSTSLSIDRSRAHLHYVAPSKPRTMHYHSWFSRAKSTTEARTSAWRTRSTRGGGCLSVGWRLAATRSVVKLYFPRGCVTICVPLAGWFSPTRTA